MSEKANHGYRSILEKDSDTKIKNKGHIRMFDNPILEILSLSSPTIITVAYGSYVAVMLWMNHLYGPVESLQQGALLYLGGIFTWTFAEYMLHRYVFHFVSDSKIWMRIHYATHGYHHEYPRDSRRLFMPPLPGAIISAVFLGIFAIFMGKFAFVFTAGFVNGYIVYSLMHYATHRIAPPKLLKGLWRHHALHHYKHPDLAFGVSTTLWDHVFRTLPPKDAQAR